MAQNPTVEMLTTEFSKVLEAWYDRWRNAIDASRVANYDHKQLCSDVTESWIQGTYASLLPLSALGPITISLKDTFPVLRFVVDAQKADVTRVVPLRYVPGATGAQSEHLRDNGNMIPNGNVAAIIAQNRYLVVSLQGLGGLRPSPPAGLYEGRVIALGVNIPVAKIEVEWPG